MHGLVTVTLTAETHSTLGLGHSQRQRERLTHVGILCADMVELRAELDLEAQAGVWRVACG